MFKLNFEVPPSDQRIRLGDKILLTGSCFSEEIGSKLAGNKFNTLSNPFGTIYNPISILKGISGQPDPADLVESQGVFYHWDCHGKISGLNRNETEDHFSAALQKTKQFVESADVLILTFGTSIVYRLKKSGAIVANCHKIPDTEFKREFLSEEEITKAFTETHQYLSKANPRLNLILTVSPVRHIRDGLIENNRSKSILIQAVHELVGHFENVHYFPSYEIVTDELRDYRFFGRDMVHPSEQAVDYIWEKFADSYFDEKTKKLLEEWKKIQQALSHKPFQPDSEAHQKFLKQTLHKLENLKEEIDVSQEIEELKSGIT